ncbi:hypothetical protein evm_015439, partial [Chilo suppressalis]
MLDNVRDVGVSSRRRDESDEPPPALPPPPRKPPRGRVSADSTSRSTGASPTRDDSSDLISFSSPTSKSAPKDAHASLKEYIDQINKQTEELTLTTQDATPATMNNQNQPPNQVPGYPYAPFYSYQYSYNAMSPSPYPPGAPYGMPTPMPTPIPTAMPAPMPTPLPNYSYYPPNIAPSRESTPVYVPANPQMYATTMHYSQTRLATPPTTYTGYRPPNPQTPAYNYNTTNMISRPPPPRPTSNLYPQLTQMHTYPMTMNPAQKLNGNNNSNNNNNTVPAAPMKNEPNKDSVERKLSEVSNA